MISIFLSINNNEDSFIFPVSPSDYDISSPFDNEQVKGLNQSLNLIGTRGIKTISISSFFPAEGKDYPFDQNGEMFGWEYVDKIESWRDRRVPVRLVIVEDGKKTVNLAVNIDKFKYGEDQSGDINFTLNFSEFPFIDISR
jgi:hypothetical protein